MRKQGKCMLEGKRMHATTCNENWFGFWSVIFMHMPALHDVSFDRTRP